MSARKRPRELEAPEEVYLLPIPKPCTVCKTTSVWGTRRGRAVHPTCEGRSDWLTWPAYRRTLHMLSEVLPIASVGAYVPDVRPPYGRGNPWEPPPAPYPCAACGQTTEVIRWDPQNVWRCPKHNPLTFPVQPWEGRGWPQPAPQGQEDQ